MQKPKAYGNGTLFTSVILNVLVCLALVCPQTSFAQTSPTGVLALTWDANSDVDLAGYMAFSNMMLGTLVDYPFY